MEKNSIKCRKYFRKYVEKDKVSAFDLFNYVKSVNAGKNIDEDNIDEWFNYGINYSGFEHLADEQIVGKVLGMVSKSEEGKIERYNQGIHEATLKHIDGIIQCM